MFCRQCGKTVREGARFCQGCGASVEVATTEEPGLESIKKDLQAHRDYERVDTGEHRDLSPEAYVAKTGKSGRGIVIGLIIGIIVVIIAAAGGYWFMSGRKDKVDEAANVKPAVEESKTVDASEKASSQSAKPKKQAAPAPSRVEKTTPDPRPDSPPAKALRKADDSARKGSWVDRTLNKPKGAPASPHPSDSRETGL